MASCETHISRFVVLGAIRTVIGILVAGLVGIAPAISLPEQFDSQEWCFGLVEANPDQPSGELRPGHIVGSGSAELSPTLPKICNQSSDLCTGPRQRVHAGDRIAIGQEAFGFVCVHYSDGSSEIDGWLPAERVKIENPKEVTLPLASWNGIWRAVNQDATIRLNTSSGELHAEGEAYWPNETNPDRNVGYLSATTIPTGNAAMVVDGDCRASLLLLGNQLAVATSRWCGGNNIRFGGFYRLDHR